MASRSKSTLTDIMERASGMMAGNPVVAPQTEQFWKAQDRVINEAESFSKAWFERRHEATHSAVDAVRKMNGNGANPTAAMQLTADWLQGSFKRMAKDMQQWVELCTNCAGRMVEAEIEAGKEGVEEAAKRTKSTAKTKHSTPV